MPKEHRPAAPAPAGASVAAAAGDGLNQETADFLAQKFNLAPELIGASPAATEAPPEAAAPEPAPTPPAAAEAPPPDEAEAPPAAAPAAEPEFTPEQKAWLEARAQTLQEQAQAAAATQKAEAEKAAARVKELEAQLAAAPAAPAPPVAPLHPLLLVDNAADLDRQEAQLSQFEQWALQNWDGAPATPASADGKTAAQPELSAEQIRAAYAQAQHTRQMVLPKARESLAAFAAANVRAREIYPELFDAQKPEYALAQALLQRAPGLRVIVPNLMTIVGDAIAGEKARTARARGAAAGPAPKPAPKVGRVSPAPAARPAAAGGKPAGLSAARVMELGGGRAALVQAIQESGLAAGS